MNARSVLATQMILLLAAAGCEMEIDSESADEIGSVEQALSVSPALTSNALTSNALTSNALTSNALTSNALTSNALTSNALTSNALTSNALTSNGQTVGEISRSFLKYAYECAMPAGTSMTVKLDGTYYTFEGQMGLAPQWGDVDGYCNSTCKRWVTACLLARTNYAGIQTRISLRQYDGTTGAVLTDVSALEENVFYWDDGAFWGNMFTGASTYGTKLPASTPLFAADGYQYKDSGFDQRFCLPGDSSCPVSLVGEVADVCTTVDHIASSCTSSSGTSSKVITVRRPPPAAGVDGPAPCERGGQPDYTHEVGGFSSYGWDRMRVPGCSACSWHVIYEEGETHCRDTQWDATCARKAIDTCGLTPDATGTAHSLCKTGTPLVRGDSECIDLVCFEDPYCCSADGAWDPACVQKVGTVCGYDCNDSDVHPSDWSWSFCSSSKPCMADAPGDCDSDSQCVAGTVCAENVGEEYGKNWEFDVCQSCRDGRAAWGSTFCSPDCPCTAGEGDCDTSADCRDGTTCHFNVGAKYGKADWLDVCERD